MHPRYPALPVHWLRKQPAASRRNPLLIGLLLALVSGGADAQTNSPAIRPVSLTDCIQMALQHNLDIRIERYAPELARYALGSSYGIYDPVFRFGAQEDDAIHPPQVDPKKSGTDLSYDLNDRSLSPSFRGELPTGLRYGFSANSDFLSINTALLPDFIRHTNEYAAMAGITLEQPLLRNFWIDAGRLNIRVNKQNLKVAELALRQQIINIVTKVQLAYYNLIQAREQVKVQEKALELAQQLLEDNRKRVRAGMLRPLDEKQSETQAALVETALYTAQQTLAAQQNTLKSLIHDNFAGWIGLRLEPTETLVAVPVAFDRAQSWQTALKLRPDFLQFQLELAKRELQVRYYFNQLFPGLDVLGSYSAQGVRSTLGNAWNDVKNSSSPAYSYGIVLTVPLSNTAERNNYRASKAARKQTELQLQKLEQEILIQVDNAGVTLQTALRQVNSTHQARLYAEEALSAEQKKYEVGLSTSFIVLELQRTLTIARSAEVRALADYNQALVQLAFSEGTTLEKNKLNLEVK